MVAVVAVKADSICTFLSIPTHTTFLPNFPKFRKEVESTATTATDYPQTIGAQGFALVAAEDFHCY